MPNGGRAVWTVKTLTGVRRICPDRITHIVTNEDVRHVLVVFQEGGETFEMRGSVVGIREGLLPYLSLVTVGKSMLINPSYICAIEGTYVTLANGHVIQVPKSATAQLKAAMLSDSF